jgi:hypothetical protein
MITAVADQPARLHCVIRQALTNGLRERYEVEREIPHELLVMLMQMNHRSQESEKS